MTRKQFAQELALSKLKATFCIAGGRYHVPELVHAVKKLTLEIAKEDPTFFDDDGACEEERNGDITKIDDDEEDDLL